MQGLRGRQAGGDWDEGTAARDRKQSAEMRAGQADDQGGQCGGQQ